MRLAAALAALLLAAQCGSAGVAARPAAWRRRPLQAGPSPAPFPDLSFAEAFGGSGADEVYDLSLDASGAAYAAGYRTRVASDRGDGGWGAAGLAAARGPEDAVAFKLTPRGDVAWLATLGGAGGGMAYAVHANPESGDALVGGYTFGLGGAPATFGSGAEAPVLRSRGSRDGFIAKISTSGSVLWATPVGGTYSDEVNGVAIDLRNNDALLGGFVGNGAPAGDPVRFGHAAEWTTHTLGGADAFVARVSADGGVLWASHFGGSGVDMVLSVGVDSEGAALAAGYFESPACTFGSGAGARVLHNAAGDGGAPGADAFALKLSAAGTLLWVVPLGGSGYDVVWGAAVAPRSDELVVGGTFEGDGMAAGAAQMDVPEPLRSTKRHGFVVKLAKDGSVAWLVPMAGAGNEDVLRVAVDAADATVFVSGVTDSYSAQFGGEGEDALTADELAQRLQPLPRGTTRAVLAQLAPDGQPLWAAVVGAGLGFALALDPVRGAAGGLALGGALRAKPAPFALPSGTASALLNGFGASGIADGFVAKFAGPLPALPPSAGAAAAGNASAATAAAAAAAAAASGSSGGGGGSALGMGAGGAAGGVAILGAAIFYVVRRRRRAAEFEAEPTEQLVPAANRRPALPGTWGAAEPMPASMPRRDSLQALAARSPSPAARGQSRLSALQAIAARAPSPAARGQSRLSALQAIAARPPSPAAQRGMPRPSSALSLAQPPSSPAWGAMSPSWGPSPVGGRPLSPGFDASRRASQQDWPVGPPHVQLAALPQRPPSPGMRPQMQRPASPGVGRAQLYPRPPSPGGQHFQSRPQSAEPAFAPQQGPAFRTQLRPQSPALRQPVQQHDSWEIRPPAPPQVETWELRPPAPQQYQRPPSPAFAPAAPPQLQFRPPSPGMQRLQPPVRDAPAELQFRQQQPQPGYVRPASPGFRELRAARAASPNLYAQRPPEAEAEQQPPPQGVQVVPPSPRPARNLRLAAASRSLSLSLQQDAMDGPASGAEEWEQQQQPARPMLQLPLAARRARMLEELARAAPGAQPREDRHDD